jgi:hypothetical protein
VRDPVTIADVRKAGHCTRGLRRWAQANGLDFADFLKHGISIARLEATGDGMVAPLLAKIAEQQTPDE